VFVHVLARQGEGNRYSLTKTFQSFNPERGATKYDDDQDGHPEPDTTIHSCGGRPSLHIVEE